MPLPWPLHIGELQALPGRIEAQLDGWREQMAALASKYKSANTFLYLGRGIHYAIAREGALKLKEASYVHAEGYPTGELKHGPNALVSDTVPLVVLATVDRTLDASVFRYEKTLQLLRDMKAQGARVIAIANSGDEEVESLVSDCVFVEPAPEYLLPIAEVVPAATVRLLHGAGARRGRGPAAQPFKGGRRSRPRGLSLAGKLVAGPWFHIPEDSHFPIQTHRGCLIYNDRIKSICSHS